MADARGPRRGSGGRRPPYVAGHRRREVEQPDAEPTGDSAVVPTPVKTSEPAEHTPDEAPAPDPVVEHGGAVDDPPSAPASDDAAAVDTKSADGEPSDAETADAESADAESATTAAEEGDRPQQIRVASTGWPERTPVGATEPLPRRTPGASGGPGGVTAPRLAADDPPAEPAAADPAPAESAADASITSPPLDEEPWAGLPGSADPTPPSDEAAGATGETTAETTGEPSDGTVDDAGAEHATPGTEDVSTSATVADEPPTATPEAPLEEAAPDATEASSWVSATGDAATDPSPRDDAAETDDPGETDGTKAPAASANDAVEPADRDDDVVPESGRSRWSRIRLVMLVVVGVLVLVAGTLNVVAKLAPSANVVSALRDTSDAYTSKSSIAAVTAASTVGVPLFSYDYRTLDQQVAQLAPLQTATCQAQYAKVINEAVRPLATQNQAVQKAQVLAAGVRSVDGNRVSVLVFISTSATNKNSTTTKLGELYLTMTMVHTHGKWLLDSTASSNAGGTGNNAPSCGA